MTARRISCSPFANEETEEMNEEKMRILGMLEDGKLTAEQAARLMDAVGSTETPSAPDAPKNPRYLRVLVTGDKEKVNVRVPIQLIRSGVNLGAMLEGATGGKVGEAMEKKGIPLNLSKLKAGEIDELVKSLAELTVDIEDGDGDQKVRVFCE
jgi:hypothetical protein